jgi:hypothetical protein
MGAMVLGPLFRIITIITIIIIISSKPAWEKDEAYLRGTSET